MHGSRTHQSVRNVKSTRGYVRADVIKGQRGMPGINWFFFHTSQMFRGYWMLIRKLCKHLCAPANITEDTVAILWKYAVLIYPSSLNTRVISLVPCTRTVMSDCIDTRSRGANVILRRPQQRDARIHIEPILRRIWTQGVLHWCPFSVIFEELFISCLLPNNIFTFAVANNYPTNNTTNNTTFWDLGWHGETLPFCHY
jgi:hypothetical protein